MYITIYNEGAPNRGALKSPMRQSAYDASGFRRVRQKQNLNVGGWNSHVQKDISRKSIIEQSQ